MVDLHCHILPGLDDGAQSLEDALEMARLAVEDGITDIVATPHTHDGIYLNRQSDVLTAVEQFQRALDEHEIPLRIHPGNEVHVHVELIENVTSFESLTIGNQRKYLLFELPVQTIPSYVDDLLYELQVEGITPIIAHPERNAVLRKEPDRLAKWVEDGAIAQVTAGSLVGTMGERSKAAAEYMVTHRLVHVVASDAHNCGNRKTVVRQAFERLGELSSQVEVMNFQSNALAILRGETFHKCEPIYKQKKKKRFLFF
ncbi:MAG: tyrosine-protein phosphatase [Tumebacillaceae bacterium]